MLAVIVLAAGKGMRMYSSLPKVLHPLGGKPMIHYVLDVASSLKPNKLITVVSPSLSLNYTKGNIITVVQKQALGTGDAVKVAFQELKDFSGDVLILYGDTPLLSEHTVQQILAARKKFPAPSLIVVSMIPKDPHHYGRVITDSQGHALEIVEYKDATPDQRKVSLCNSGVMLGDAATFRRLLTQLKAKNQANEYYLTDCVALANQEGISCPVMEAEEMDFKGINTRVELAQVERELQQRWRQQAMQNGATLIDPMSVFFSHDTSLGQDVTIGPFVTFGKGVKIGNNVTIKPYCYIESTTIEEGAQVGPFAHTRGDTLIGPNADVGNFVEIKKSTLANNAKVKHLSYIGDATIGKNTNVGAGTITCNYDGSKKSATTIGADAFIGSNTALVAPVAIGDGAIIAAGSVITENVPKDALALARSQQVIKPNWASQQRKKNKGP